MTRRFATPDGTWRVDVITLDGAECFRVYRDGYAHGGARYPRTIAELEAAGVPVAQLREIPALRWQHC